MGLASSLSRSDLLRMQVLYLAAAAVLVPFGAFYAFLTMKGWSGGVTPVIVLTLGVTCAYWTWTRLDRRLRDLAALATALQYRVIGMTQGWFNVQFPEPIAIAAALTIFVSFGSVRPVLSTEAAEVISQAQVVIEVPA